MTGSHDHQPKLSINQLKRKRLEMKYKLRHSNPLRKPLLKQVNDLIRVKQAHYHALYQYVPKFRWGMKLPNQQPKPRTSVIQSIKNTLKITKETI